MYVINSTLISEPISSEHSGHGRFTSREAIDTIAGLVSERLSGRPIASNWQSYDNVQPSTAYITSDPHQQPYQYESEVKKSDFNDVFDLKKALSKVPHLYRSEAKTLLREIEKKSPEITFNAQGVIFFYGESIPESNFFKYLPLLYKKRVPKNLPGFSDFVTKLVELGLNKYFHYKAPSNFKTTLDKRLQEEIGEGLDRSATKNWWVLT